METKLRALPTTFHAVLDGIKASYEYLGLSIVHSALWLACHFPFAMIVYITVSSIVAIYPDNGRIPYVAEQGGIPRLYLAEQKNGTARMVPTPGLSGVADPVLSPDGRRIALVANGALYIMAEDGSEPEALTGPGRYASPAFSPDGSQIAYVAFDEAGLGELYRIDLDGRRTKRLTENGVQDLNPVFATEAPPNPRQNSREKAVTPARQKNDGGPLLVFSRPDKDGNLELFAMSVDGGKARQLTRSGPAVANVEPAASPDGSRIAYLSKSGGRAELWLINTDGGERRRLAGNGGVAGSPVFSPSGTKVYYLANRDKEEAALAPLRVVNADGSWDRLPTREASMAILRYLALLGFLGLMVTGPLLAAPANAAMIYVTSRVGEGEARLRDFFLGFGRFFARSAAVYASFLLVAAILVFNLVAAAQMRVWLGKISLVLSGYALLLLLLLSIHFFPLIVLQQNSIWKVWRKALLLTLDNGLLTLVFALISALLWVVSGLACFILSLFYPAVLSQASTRLFTALLDKYERLEQAKVKV